MQLHMKTLTALWKYPSHVPAWNTLMSIGLAHYCAPNHNITKTVGRIRPLKVKADPVCVCVCVCMCVLV